VIKVNNFFFNDTATTEIYTGGASVAACPPNSPCDAGVVEKTPSMCTTTTVKACAFKWQLPCNADADCRAGFTCKPTVSGACSGGGGSSGPGTMSGSGGTGTGTPRSGSGAAYPPAPAARDGGTDPTIPMCTTTMSFPGYCQPTVTTCNSDTDCPANWKCIESPDTAVDHAPSPAGSGGSSGGAPPPTVSAKMCASAVGPPVRGGDKTESAGTPGVGTGGTTHAGGPTDPAVPPATGNTAADNAATPAKSSGCSIGGGASASGAGLAMLAVLGLLIRRRRR